MRMNIMFGLDHVDADQRNEEVQRLLVALCGSVYKAETPLVVGDTIILRDANGNRVGVADVFKD
jgi:hypothetical protein